MFFRNKLIITLFLCISLTLTVSCGTKSGSSVSGGDYSNFPFAVTNDDPPIKGGTLKVGIAASDPLKGIFAAILYEDSKDSSVLGWFEENIVSFDSNFVADQDGASTYTLDKDARSITLYMKEGVKWHDGASVTLDDLVFAYEVICHPDYEGPRYNEDFKNVVGAAEYHEGKARAISGLELSKDKMTLTIRFIEIKPTILVGGFWVAAAPRHYLGDIPVKDLLTSEKIRTKPIGFGPFKVKTVVSGEAVEFERYDDYWRGRPLLDGVSLKVVNPDMVPQAMESGELDVCDFSAQVYPDYLTPSNYQYIGQLATAYTYTGFDLGDFDKEKRTNVSDPGKKMTNRDLRQAIGYAVNNAAIGEDLYNGLRVPATTIITPRHAGYQNSYIMGYYYDPEKAKQLLDAAGYTDMDGDGYREDLNGERLTIYWAMMDGPGAETIAQFKIQNWKDVGLRVQLFNGRLLEMNVFYNYVQYDEPGIDMFDGAWQTGFDPDPFGLWGDHDWNFPHATTPELMAAMTACSSEQAWDDEFRANAYRKWQELFFEEAMAIPTLWRTEIVAVNNRVKNYDMSSSDIDMKLHLIELTATAPYRK